MKKQKTQEEINQANARKGLLTVEQVVWIKMELERGISVQDIADVLVMSYQTIARIRDGKTWRWVKTLADAEKAKPNLPPTESMRYAANASLAKLLAENQNLLGQEPKEEDDSGVGRLAEETKKNPDMLVDELIRERAADLLGKKKEA